MSKRVQKSMRNASRSSETIHAFMASCAMGMSVVYAYPKNNVYSQKAHDGLLENHIGATREMAMREVLEEANRQWHLDPNNLELAAFAKRVELVITVLLKKPLNLKNYGNNPEVVLDPEF